MAAKRRWSQGFGSGDNVTVDALAGVLNELRAGKRVTIEEPDPVTDAIDVTPNDSPEHSKE